MGETGALYFSLFVIPPGIFIIVGLNCAWLLNSHAGYHKRAMAIGMNQSIGNSAGVVVDQIFKTKVDGKYLPGLSFSLGAMVLAARGHATLYWHLRSQNKSEMQCQRSRGCMKSSMEKEVTSILTTDTHSGNGWMVQIIELVLY
ncbi:Fc.00g094310.m01.CDS01 [Cosmosporella sp. VM-42]